MRRLLGSFRLYGVSMSFFVLMLGTCRREAADLDVLALNLTSLILLAIFVTCD